MPRSARTWEPGDILSIVVRAHEGRPIFATLDDRLFFVHLLRRVFVASAVDLLAWALLINHFHLVIRVTVAPPATRFRRLNTAVARRERGWRGDHGAVLQDRCWSKPCVGEGIVRLLTYVLGNPVHHGVVPTAECRARAVLVHVACDGVGVPVVEVARLLGVSAAAASSARHRGPLLLAELGWTVDDVVAWSVRTG